MPLPRFGRRDGGFARDAFWGPSSLAWVPQIAASRTVLLARLTRPALLFCLALAGCGSDVVPLDVEALNKPLVLTGQTMGTAYSVKCWTPEAQPAEADVQSRIDALLAQIDEQMSNYRDDSELSRFNQAPADQWFDVSAPTARVVDKAIHYHWMTGGASDVTIGPLAGLWQFGPHRQDPDRDDEEPSPESVQQALALVGADKLTVRHEPPALRKSIDALEVDLSSIAKGYGVDAVGQLLDEMGFSNWMVEIGGEVHAHGTRPDGQPWRIGVENPAAGQRALSTVVPLVDMAMATSGDYRNFRTIGGNRYSHILDPRTGRPMPYRGISVTVLAPTCLEADALATALLVMGDDKAYNWCVEHNLAAMFHLRSNDQEPPQIRSTPLFSAIVDEAGETAQDEALSNSTLSKSTLSKYTLSKYTLSKSTLSKSSSEP